MLAPPVRRNSVCNGERFDSENESSKPLCTSPERDSTVIVCSASMTSCEAGTGTAGPMNSCRRTPLDVDTAGHPFGRGDPEPLAHGVGERARVERAVGIGELPPQLGIAEVARGEQVAPVAF